MAKKGENIYKRKDGRWEGRYIKKREKSGKIIYGSIYGKKYSEVKNKLMILKANHLEQKQNLVYSSHKFSDWLIYWMTTKVRNNVKQTTYSNYRRLAEKHIIPDLGEYKMQELQPKLLQNYIYLLQEKGLAAGSIKNIFNIVKKSLKDAQRQELIYENPCATVELPQLTKKRIYALTMLQQRKLENVAFEEKKCSAIILALYSGMRIGEISGLKWSDIDFERDLIFVNRTVSRITAENSVFYKTKLIEDTPKTSESIRQIPLAESLKKYLEDKKRMSTSDYVIENDKGGLTEPRTITNKFKKQVKQAGLEDFNFHVLRHTFATRCIENGVDIASLSKILGHQSIKMTLDTYTDSLMETRRLAMATIDVLFKKNYKASK